MLDANLSPKIGRFLSISLGLDVVSILTLGKGQVTDPEVLRIARSLGRIVITLDRDFSQQSSAVAHIVRGVIYLDLPSHRRYTPDIQQILDDFFRNYADSIDLEQSLVIVHEDEIEIL